MYPARVSVGPLACSTAAGACVLGFHIRGLMIFVRPLALDASQSVRRVRAQTRPCGADARPPEEGLWTYANIVMPT